ncbi:hypothetical protein RJ641_031455 [Dillenia turbinata]|uniref:Longin domain-containing protein n=1 Tax=Dillenia turbinata TaxID=194707 RepID=A0AAN8W2L9_9MAGN
MDSVGNTVLYCSVSKGNRIFYAYNGGDHEIENLAALCLKGIPPFHKWYFHTMGKKTFGFLMEDGCVYFAIMDRSFGNQGVLSFLEHLRDEFRKLSKKAPRGSVPSLNSICIREQLLSVIHHLIASLEQVSRSDGSWSDVAPLNNNQHGLSALPNTNVNGHMEIFASTKAPLLGKYGKQEKKRMKDHVVSVRENELEEPCKSTDRGVKADSATIDLGSQGGVALPISLQKDLSSRRMIRSSSQSVWRKCHHHERIVLAIDVLVCVTLFGIWLIVCHGFECIR